MADNPDYEVGTASITAGTKVLTGVDTFWTSAELEKGDQFGIDGYPMARIDTVGGDGSITLLDNWQGPTLAGQPYFIRYQADSRFIALLVAVRKILSQPLLAAFAGLAAAADKLPYFTGAGTMALADFGANARATLAAAKAWTTSLFGLTMAADKLPYGTGVNTMALADFTAFARTILDDPNASAALSTLGITAFIKTLLDDPDAPTLFTTLGITQGGSGGNRWYKIPMGGSPVGLLVQVATQVVTTSSGGAAIMTHPTPFFSDITYGVVAWSGDDTQGNIILQHIRNATPLPSATQFAARVRIANTAALVASTPVRVDWIAIGAAP